MPFKDGSSRLFITPYYDGYQLAGVQEVAGDGLSAISIKESHNKCKIILGSNSKHTEISCTRGIKARNSFRNLHKPDLRKAKGLECSTTGSITQLLRTHNLENPVRLTYKKKIFRILESLVTKKAKGAKQTQPTTHNVCTTPPEDLCILSSICEESDSTPNQIVKSPENLSDKLNDTTSNKNSVEENFDESFEYELSNSDSCPMSTFTVFKSTPSSIHFNTSNNILLSSKVITDTSDSKQEFNKTSKSFYHQPSIASTKIQLKTKKSLLDMTLTNEEDILIQNVSSGVNGKIINNLDCEIEELSVRHDDIAPKCQSLVPSDSVENIKNNSDDLGIQENGKKDNGMCISENRACENPSREIINSIFTEILAEMQEIEDYISSYVSSFCVREEEFQNYPALTRKSSEVVSHFFDEVHPSFKVKTEHHKNDSLKSATSKEVNNTFYTSGTESGGTASVNESENQFKKEIFADPKLKMEGSRSFTEEIHFPMTDNKIQPENFQGYCFWDDMDATNPKETLFGESTVNNNMFDKYEHSIVPFNFFEDVWYDLVGCISRDFFAYNTFTNVYDESILAEAKCVLESINMFIDNECFPSPSNSNGPLNTCTIIEIEDSNDQLYFTNNLEENAKTLNVNVGDMLADSKTEQLNCRNEILDSDVLVIEDSRKNLTKNYNENVQEDFNILQEMINVSTFNKDQSVIIEDVNVLKNAADHSDELNIEFLNKNSNGNGCSNHKSSKNIQMNDNNNSQVREAEISKPLRHLTNNKDNISNITPGVNKNSSNVITMNGNKPLSVPNKMDSDLKKPGFVQKSERDLNEQHSNLLFSSPHLKLNLTNPLIDLNKK